MRPLMKVSALHSKWRVSPTSSFLGVAVRTKFCALLSEMKKAKVDPCSALSISPISEGIHTAIASSTSTPFGFRNTSSSSVSSRGTVGSAHPLQTLPSDDQPPFLSERGPRIGFLCIRWCLISSETSLLPVLRTHIWPVHAAQCRGRDCLCPVGLNRGDLMGFLALHS